MPQSNQTKIRWWPLAAFCLLYLGALISVWTGEVLDRQNRITHTLGYSLLLGFGTFVWLLFFARLQARTRWRVVGSFGALLVLLFATVRIQGVSGDLLPVLAWRWSKSADSQLDSKLQTAIGTPGLAIQETDHDFPRYLGPTGDAVLTKPRLFSDWQARPPRELWRIPVGLAWSGFAVVGNCAVTMEQRGNQEMVICYDLQTGKSRWQYGVTTRYQDTVGGDGPRTTPAMVGGKVYALGATGMLSCLDLANGRKLWSVDVLAENNAFPPTYGVSASPVVLEDRVLVVAGGEPGRCLVAYDRHSGLMLFGGGDDTPGYSTPVPTQIAGVDQYLLFNGDALASYDAGDGAELWRFPWPPGSEHVSQPIPISGGRVFLSSGYGIGARMIQVHSDGEQFSVRQLWSSLSMKAKFTVIVHRDGYFYGLDDGVLACIDAERGERRWKRGRFGHGQLLLVGDTLLVLGESGDVALVKAVPDDYHELAHIEEVIHGKTWNPLALAGQHLLVRNSTEAVCLALPLE